MFPSRVNFLVYILHSAGESHSTAKDRIVRERRNMHLAISDKSQLIKYENYKL